jgi:hypothetical protein
MRWLLFLWIGCGGRSPLSPPLDATADAEEVEDAGDAGPDVIPVEVCYRMKPDTTCSVSGGGDESRCAVRHDCEGHIITGECAGRLCHCTNVGINDCWCRMPEGLSACGVANCCLRR